METSKIDLIATQVSTVEMDKIEFKNLILSIFEANPWFDEVNITRVMISDKCFLNFKNGHFEKLESLEKIYKMCSYNRYLVLYGTGLVEKCKIAKEKMTPLFVDDCDYHYDCCLLTESRLNPDIKFEMMFNIRNKTLVVWEAVFYSKLHGSLEYHKMELDIKDGCVMSMNILHENPCDDPNDSFDTFPADFKNKKNEDYQSDNSFDLFCNDGNRNESLKPQFSRFNSFDDCPFGAVVVTLNEIPDFNIIQLKFWKVICLSPSKITTKAVSSSQHNFYLGVLAGINTNFVYVVVGGSLQGEDNNNAKDISSAFKHHYQQLTSPNLNIAYFDSTIPSFF